MNVININLKIKILSHVHLTPNIAITENSELVEQMLQFKGSTITSSLVSKMAQRIYEQYGVEKRYLSSKPFLKQYDSNITTESLAKNCLSKLDLQSLKSVDCIFMGTTTPVRYTGSQAAAISTVTENFPACYDLKAGCSTSLATLHNACMFLRSGVKTILAVTAETLSKVINPTNPETWFGLADGAAALILQNTQQPDFIIQHSYFSVDGNYVNAYTVPGALPPRSSAEVEESYFMQGDGQLMEEVAYTKYLLMFDYLKKNNILEKIKFFIPHQVNRSLINKVLEKYSLHATVVWDAKNIGNIGGSSVLYSLSKLLGEDALKSGDHLLMMSVGGGISSSFQVWQKC